MQLHFSPHHTFQKWSGCAFQKRKSTTTEGWVARKAWNLLLSHHPIRDPLTTWTIWSQLHQPSWLSLAWLLVFQAPQPRDPDWRHCFKGQSKHDCKQKPENPPAASISTLPNYQTFTDKWNQSTRRAKLWKISAAGKSYTILPYFQCLDANEDRQEHHAVPFVFSGHWKTISGNFY